MELLARKKLALQAGKKTFVDPELGKFNDKRCNNIEHMVELAFNHYTALELSLTFKEKDLKDCKKWTEKALLGCNGMFDPLERVIVEPEYFFDYIIPDDWAKYKYTVDGQMIEGRLAIKGTIDLITKVDDNIYEIIDYKTGKRKDWNKDIPKSYDYLQTDFQLMLYYYVLKQLFPDRDFLVTVYFINDGGPFTIIMNEDRIKLVKKLVQQRFNMIKHCKMPKLLQYDRNHWKCYRLCTFAKKTFEGDKCCICQRVRDCIKKRGIDATTQIYKHPDFDINSYDAPGS